MSMCEPGCNHSSHENEKRFYEKMLRREILPKDPPHLVKLAYTDAVYQLTRVGKLLQKADRFSQGGGI